jgi:hypothetical protein
MSKSKRPAPKQRYLLKPLSFWPLKPEEVLRAFMQVNPDKIDDKTQPINGKRVKKVCFVK